MSFVWKLHLYMGMYSNCELRLLNQRLQNKGATFRSIAKISFRQFQLRFSWSSAPFKRTNLLATPILEHFPGVLHLIYPKLKEMSLNVSWSFILLNRFRKGCISLCCRDLERTALASRFGKPTNDRQSLSGQSHALALIWGKAPPQFGKHATTHGLLIEFQSRSIRNTFHYLKEMLIFEEGYWTWFQEKRGQSHVGYNAKKGISQLTMILTL